jgi:hypothetical protein
VIAARLTSAERERERERAQTSRSEDGFRNRLSRYDESVASARFLTNQSRFVLRADERIRSGVVLDCQRDFRLGIHRCHADIAVGIACHAHAFDPRDADV